jgi:replicative DNA helicase
MTGSPVLLTGAEFVLDAPTTQQAIWGSGEEILWSAGESMYLTGPLGTGKSTLQQQLLMGRLGLREEVLGWPVADDGRPSVLIAADRPAQIKRSMARMFGEEHRAVIEERLRVQKGPPPLDIVKHPELLVEFVGDAGSLFIDSLKDLARPLTSDEVGASVNRALQLVIEGGCQVVVLHHHRKATSENKRPRAIADVYGSLWLPAGAGSVVTLWGEPGDSVVELLHLKAPAEEVGPLELEHDHQRGESRRCDRLDAWVLLHRAGDGGIGAGEVAATIYGKTTPTRSDVEKVRRRLERFVREGKATRIGDGQTIGEAVRYVPVENGSVTERDGNRDASRTPSRSSRFPTNRRHAPSRPESPSRAPLEGASREGPHGGSEDGTQEGTQDGVGGSATSVGSTADLTAAVEVEHDAGDDGSQLAWGDAQHPPTPAPFNSPEPKSQDGETLADELASRMDRR